MVARTRKPRLRRLRRQWRQWRRGQTLEQLEARQLLAGDTATLVDDTLSVHQNSDPVVLDVMENDVFGDQYAGAREISAVSYGSQGGRLEISPDRKSVIYAPPADYAGEEQFSYFVDGSFFATVKMEIESPLGPDEYRLPPDGQVHSLSVMRNDRFWDGYDGPRRITFVSVTSGESEVEIAEDGRSLLYRPDETASGRDEFIYIVDEIYPARVKIDTVAALAPDQIEVLTDLPLQSVDVLANDPFWNGYEGPREITFVSQSLWRDEQGTLEIVAGGKSLLYTPSPDGRRYSEQFNYVVDGRFETSVTLFVKRPVQDDFVEIDINSQDFRLDVLSNDQYYSSVTRNYVDIVDRVTSVGATSSGGTVRLESGGRGLIYSAPVGFSGIDTFTYVADNWYDAEVTIRIARPVRDDWLTAYQDTPNQNLPVMENDFVGNGYDGPRRLTSVTQSEQLIDPVIVGSAIQYTPPERFVGGDSFGYVVDNELDANVQLNVVPLAQNDSFRFCSQPNQTYTLDVLGNDHFRRGYLGSGLIDSVEIINGGGSVSVSGDGRSLIYSPGSSSNSRLRYSVDGKYEAEVTIWRDNFLRRDEQVVDQNSSPTSINVMSNDFTRQWRYRNCGVADYTGARRITSVSASENGGTVQVAADGQSVLYEPASDFLGQDTFTYAVDDTMEMTVSVQVVRRVRDDSVRVQPGATEVLSVIENDLFGADYAGAQKITDVTASTIGATVEISPDGRGLLYTSPSDFSGTDTLTYTVDGKLKAEIEVAVRADGENAFAAFGSLAEYQEFLIQDALTRYAGQFGQRAFFSRGESVKDFDSGPSVTPTSADRDFSETNVQVAGIDEADIVEFDADYVYFLTGNDVVILDAWPADQLHEVSRTPIMGEAIAQYLNGDRLTVISQIVQWPEPVPYVDDGVLIDSIRPVDFFPYRPASYQTITTVLDVSDRSSPSLVQRTTFEGQYVQSRGIGDYVYLALSNQALPPGPRVIPDDTVTEETPVWDRGGTYETEEQYLERVRANLGEFVDEALPNYNSVGPDGELVRSGLVHEPEDVFRPISQGAASLVSLVSINIKNDEPGLTGSSGVYTNGATQVYASQEHFYVFEQGYEQEDGAVTRILQFDWDKSDGSAQFASSGLVPGYMLNQFSADEYDGYLRIVTTVSHSYSGNWTSTSENDLFVLRDDGGTLEFTGSLQNLGVGETARSVRFMGPRAFLVTFRNVDPLFGLDVSDPTNPKSVGHLTLPGFSSYMQVIDDNYLLTVGRNTPNGGAGPAQVSLFDVTDLTKPRLVDEYTMERFSQSEAAVDHRAFGYFARHGLLAVPASRSYVVRTDEDQDGYAETRNWVTDYDLMVFRIDVNAEPGTDQGVRLTAEISHDSPVRRSGYIGDKLFSIAEDSINVSDVDAPDTILATASNLRRNDPITPDPRPELDAMAAVLRQAQSDVAMRLDISAGAPMPIVAERGEDGWQSVVRVDDAYYRYEGEGDSLRLAGVGFEFAAAGQSVSWQNPVDPADVNGDGEVAPNDAIAIINYLAGDTSQSLSSERVLRQIQDAQQIGGPFWDVNGDGVVSPLDVLSVVNRVNQTATQAIDTGGLRVDDPSTLADIAAVEAFYDRVMGTAGDVNLDGRFDSADLIQIFQQGKYEDSIPNNAAWSDGDWDGDGDFTTADLVLAFTQGRYRSE